MKDLNEAKIFWENARYNDIDLRKFYEYTASEISKKIIKKYGKTKSFAVIAGVGGNGADGLAVALALKNDGVENLNVYVTGRTQKFNSPLNLEFYNEIKKQEIEMRQDAFAKDIEPAEVIIEAMVGTGLEGAKLNKRYKDIIKRIAHFDAKVIAIDIASPHYNPDKTYSILYPKEADAEVISYQLPQELLNFCGPGEFNALWEPNKKTHTKKNGKMLLICNTKDESAIKITTEAANTYCVYTYIYNINNETSLRSSKNYEFIEDCDLPDIINSVDTVLFGEFDENSMLNLALVKEVIANYLKTFIFYSDILLALDLEMLSSLFKTLIIPSRNHIQKFSGDKKIKFLDRSLRRVCIERKINAILPGSKTLLFNENGDMKISFSQNVYNKGYANMLASVIAAYSTKNDLWLSMRAGVFAV